MAEAENNGSRAACWPASLAVAVARRGRTGLVAVIGSGTANGWPCASAVRPGFFPPCRKGSHGMGSSAGQRPLMTPNCSTRSRS